MEKMLGLKTLKNTYLAWTQGLTNLVRAFLTDKNRGLLMLKLKKKVVTCSCKKLDFLLFVPDVYKKIAHVHIFWYHYVHSITVL